ncbi:MAG: hypothetical protein PHC33_03560 [Candidatus Omnitrophica bacterium]|nr:hypothetical protein [Candidatus Omnitrophota bacterium]
MRDLVFRNMTSNNHKRRVVACSEVMDNGGVRSIVRRHFVCLVNEITSGQVQKPVSYLHIVREKNSYEQRERFFCRLKGSILAVNNERFFRITFVHSLKICLSAIPQGMSK